MTLPRPEPFYFGGAAQPLAGWLHLPDAATAPRLGLVLCNPLFHESLSTDCTMRGIARAAAAHGIPALRFDYRGTRDSSGSGADDDQVPAWIESVGCAIDTLKHHGGVDQVCVLGIRLGATVAALAAAGRTDVAALVAIAPVVRGRAYLREMRAFSLRSAGDGGVVGDAEDIVGFTLTPQTRAAISRLDLLAVTTRIAPRVLLIERNDMPSDGAFDARLRSHESQVDRRQMTGFADMMLDPHLSVVPAEMVLTVSDWLDRECAPTVASAQPNGGGRPNAPRTIAIRLPAPGSGTDANAIQETARYLDGDGTLFGIITEPVAPAARPPSGRPSLVIVLLNAGAAQHTGPGRLYVALARTWAAEGHVVLRMDLSGLGESATRPGAEENIVYSAFANQDVAAALAFIRREYPGARCYVTGICSGAYHGFKAAVAGVDVDGVIAINPLTFFWREGMSYEAGPAQAIESATRNRAAGFRLETWRRLLAGRIRPLGALGVLSRRGRAIGIGRLREIARVLHIALTDDLAAELCRVAQRKIDLLFVFSAGDPGQQLLIDQGGSTVTRLARRGALRVEVIEGADHIFTHRSSKERLFAVLTGNPLAREPFADTDSRPLETP